jgi:hypothetical protein
MNFEEALKLADTVVFAKTNRHLTEKYCYHNSRVVQWQY